ncbi:hypothetical protein ACP76Z_02600 [Vibrio cholerae]
MSNWFLKPVAPSHWCGAKAKPDEYSIARCASYGERDGPSPIYLSYSVLHNCLPWELGLGWSTHGTLLRKWLRNRIVVKADGR